MKISGDLEHRERLRRLRSPAARRAIGQAVFVAAQEVETQARLLIMAGSVSGKNHVPSKPGEPPNNDTGYLAANIEATRRSELTAQVESKAEYGAALERGTSKMAARPYMVPALRMKRARVNELIRGAFRRAIR